jgi:hypothetical protein
MQTHDHTIHSGHIWTFILQRRITDVLQAQQAKASATPSEKATPSSPTITTLATKSSSSDSPAVPSPHVVSPVSLAKSGFSQRKASMLYLKSSKTSNTVATLTTCLRTPTSRSRISRQRITKGTRMSWRGGG